jgi:hypothetical protein
MPPIPAEPYPFAFEPRAAALLIIDMQRDRPSRCSIASG